APERSTERCRAAAVPYGMKVAPVLLLVLPLLAASARACDAAPRSDPRATRYTFAWPLGEGMPRPRGATTRGAPVTLDPEPGEAWKRLRAPELAPFERDRRAILA